MGSIREKNGGRFMSKAVTAGQLTNQKTEQFKEPKVWHKAATRVEAFAKTIFWGIISGFAAVFSNNKLPWANCQRAFQELKTGLTTDQSTEKFCSENGFKKRVFT